MTDATPVGNARPGGPAGVSRRSLLAAAGVALPILITACKGVQALGTPPPPAREIRVLRAAITAEEQMVARYTTALTRLPTANAALLTAVRAVQAEHSAHLAQLKSRLIEPAGARPLPVPKAPAVAAGSPGSVLGALEQAEQAASNRLLEELAVLPPALAQLFASVGASEATHVPFLQQAVAAAG